MACLGFDRVNDGERCFACHISSLVDAAVWVCTCTKKERMGNEMLRTVSHLGESAETLRANFDPTISPSHYLLVLYHSHFSLPPPHALQSSP